LFRLDFQVDAGDPPAAAAAAAIHDAIAVEDHLAQIARHQVGEPAGRRRSHHQDRLGLATSWSAAASSSELTANQSTAPATADATSTMPCP
jgi:hypothetical protein